MDNDNEDNVVKFGSIQGGKAKDDKEFPSNPYVILDVDDEEHYYDGYMIFTTHHVCIMQEGDDGTPVTAFMIPMHRVKDVSLAVEDEVTIN